jgi:hypothetical protein
VSGRLTEAERRALLAGDRADTLDADEVAEVDVLAGVLADPSTWVEPDAGLEDRVVRAVTDASPAEEASGARTSGRDPRVQSRRRRLAVAIAGVAASIVAVVGVLAVSGGGGAGSQFAATLGPTALAPGAHATAAVTHNGAGFRIELDARGLRALPDGAYYQGWLRNAKGGQVSIGTFSSSDDDIVLWSGVSPREYRSMTVTVEPDDDNPRSSGRRVLAGAVRAT